MSSEVKTALELLEEAPRVLDQRGWFQGSWTSAPHGMVGPVCAMGALNVAGFGVARPLERLEAEAFRFESPADAVLQRAEFWRATNALSAVIRELELVGPDCEPGVADFNDDYQTTEGDVRGLFAAAAERLRTNLTIGANA